MMNMEIFEKVKTVIEYVSDINSEEITEDSSLINDLDLSSLEIMRIVTELEAVFSLRVLEKDIRGFVLVRDLVNYIAEKNA